MGLGSVIRAPAWPWVLLLPGKPKAVQLMRKRSLVILTVSISLNPDYPIVVIDQSHLSKMRSEAQDQALKAAVCEDLRS